MGRPSTGKMQSHLHWLYAALHERIGIIVKTNRRDSLLATLQGLKRSIGDPDLDDLSFVRSPTSKNEIWIIKRNPDLGPSQE